MKKIVLLTLLTASLFAGQNDDYIGLGIGYTSFSADKQYSEINTDGMSLSFTLGHYYGDYGRFNASYTYIKSEENIDESDMLSLAYDFMLPINDSIALYVGPVAGYTRYSEHDNLGNEINLSGLHIGGELGGVFNFSEKLEVEAGYRYLSEAGEDTYLGQSIKAQSMSMFYFGVNYHFDADKTFRYE